MSSHRLSVSGERPYQINAGGGPYSAAQFPSRQTDGIQFNAQGFSRIEIPLTMSARVERHRHTLKGQGSGVVHDSLVLVLGSEDPAVADASISLYGYPREGAAEGETVGGENSNLDVRKPGDNFGPFAYYENDEVVEVLPLQGTWPEGPQNAGKSA